MQMILEMSNNMEDRIEYGTDGRPYKLFMSTEVPDKTYRWEFGPTPEFPMAIKGMSKEEMLDTLRPKGEWKIGGRTTHYHYCSICGKDGDLQDNFCRNCGAKMTKSNSDSETNYYGVKTVLLSQPSDEVATFDREEQPTVYPSRIGYQDLYCTEAPEEKKPKRGKRE